MKSLIKETDMMTAANPPELRPTNIWAESVMNILMKDTDMMTAANPPEFRPNGHSQLMKTLTKETYIMKAADPLNLHLQIYGQNQYRIFS